MLRDCPCHSGELYEVCCAPYHRNQREAPSPEALMRSRYAAYALGFGAYLVRTLAKSHPDSALPREELERVLSRAKERQRFNGLRILHSSSVNDRGEVLFFARVFERGQDRSFAELSDFVREGEGWRYATGILVSKASLPADLDAMTVASFLSLAEQVKSQAPRV